MCSPDRKGRTLQSHQGRGFLTLFWPHTYKTWMLHYCTSQENNTCGNTNQKGQNQVHVFELKQQNWKNCIPYSKKQLFSSRLVEVEDVAGWKPQAVLFSKKAKQAAVQRRYFCSVQKEKEKPLKVWKKQILLCPQKRICHKSKWPDAFF